MDKIISIGIYQRLLARLSQKEFFALDRKLIFFDQTRLRNVIAGLFDSINVRMVRLIESHYDLKQVLSYLKGFFFLENCDIYNSLLETAYNNENISKKDNFKKQFECLQWTLPGFYEHLSCELSDVSVYEQLITIMTGKKELYNPTSTFGILTLCYPTIKLSFPLCLIVDEDAIKKYQILFRHLFGILIISNKLSKKKIISKLVPVSINRYSVAIKHTILSFFQNLHSHIAHDVLEPHFKNLTEVLSKVPNYNILFINWDEVHWHG